MIFHCLGYPDDKLCEAMSQQEQEAHVGRCQEYERQLREAGHFHGGGCLGDSTRGRVVRLLDGQPAVSDSPMAEAKELVGAVLHLEARDMEQAVELISKHPGLKAGFFEIRPAMEPEKFFAVSPGEQVRSAISAWSRALEAKDVDAMMAHYLEDAVLFDAIPPYKVVGREAIAQAYRSCLPFFPERFVSEHRDLSIQVEGDLAYAFGLHHFAVEEPANHPAGRSWMRVSVCLRKVGGAWKVVHEHLSLPFNPLNGQSWSIPDPEKLEAPDYGCGAMSEVAGV
jgi:ketosteroid isomerase-like protein